MPEMRSSPDFKVMPRMAMAATGEEEEKEEEKQEKQEEEKRRCGRRSRRNRGVWTMTERTKWQRTRVRMMMALTGVMGGTMRDRRVLQGYL